LHAKTEFLHSKKSGWRGESATRPYCSYQVEARAGTYPMIEARAGTYPMIEARAGTYPEFKGVGWGYILV